MALVIEPLNFVVHSEDFSVEMDFVAYDDLKPDFRKNGNVKFQAPGAKQFLQESRDGLIAAAESSVGIVKG